MIYKYINHIRYLPHVLGSIGNRKKKQRCKTNLDQPLFLLKNLKCSRSIIHTHLLVLGLLLNKGIQKKFLLKNAPRLYLKKWWVLK